MTNQFEPAEFLRLTNGSELVLRPTNIARYGLEAYCNSIQGFTHGMTTGAHKHVNLNPETVNGRKVDWFTCQMDIKDGWTSDVVRTRKAPGRSPNWFGQPGIFRGDCEYHTKRQDDMRRHFLSQHPGISQDYFIKCPVCHFRGRTVALVRKHMDKCQGIYKWAANGCDPGLLCPKYILHMSHWSSEKISGDTHYQKSVVGDPKEHLKKLRKLTGGTVAKDVNVTRIANDETESIQSDSIDDALIDSLLESETESLDGIEFGPPKENDTHTNVNDDLFDVNQHHYVLRMYNDKNYREDRSDAGKNEIILALCQAVLEKQTLLDIGHKLNVIRKKFEGYSLDCDFLWEIQGAFYKQLGGHIVKSEGNDPFKSLESFFPVGSLNAENVKTVHKLLKDYESNYVALPRDQIIDLTGDCLIENQRILKLKKKISEGNENLQAQLAAVCLSKSEFEEFKKESKIEKNSMDQKLSQATQAMKDLEQENRELKEEKRMAASARVDMQKLAVDVKKNKELVQIDMFANIPSFEPGQVKYDAGNGKSGQYGIHSTVEDELKKEQQKLKQEQRNKRKVGTSYADEVSHLNRSRKVAKLTSAEHSIPKSRNKKCGMECEDVLEENYRLNTVNSQLFAESQRIMIASAVNFRQYLCTQAFCDYSMQYLYDKDFRSKRRMHKFLYCILPRFVETFKHCSTGMDAVKPVLINMEAQAWQYFGSIPPSQNLGYFFCEEMILRKTTTPQGLVNSLSTAESVNLCTKCDEEIASHPPNTCQWVTADLTKEFQGLRDKFIHSWLKTKESYDLDSSQFHIGAHGIELESVNTY